MLEKISGTFEEIFKQELPEFLRKKYIETTKELRKSALSLGLGCAALIPYVSNIASAISLTQSSRELFANLNQYLRSREEFSNYNLHLKNKERMLRQWIEKYNISEKSTLLDALELLTNTISIKIKLLRYKVTAYNRWICGFAFGYAQICLRQTSHIRNILYVMLYI